MFVMCHKCCETSVHLYVNQKPSTTVYVADGIMSNREKVKTGGNRSENNNNNHSSHNNTQQQKQIQTLLRKEGRSARNLISWNVPFEHQEQLNVATSNAQGTRGGKMCLFVN